MYPLVIIHITDDLVVHVDDAEHRLVGTKRYDAIPKGPGKIIYRFLGIESTCDNVQVTFNAFYIFLDLGDIDWGRLTLGRLWRWETLTSTGCRF